jgi:hypothetical protein
MLRTQGLIKQLWDARATAKDRELSLDERKKKKKSKVRYGFGGYWYPGTAYAGQDQSAGSEGSGDGGGGESVREDAGATPVGVNPTTQMFLNEQNDTESVVMKFIDDVATKLQIDNLPQIELHSDAEWSKQAHSFGRYEPDTHTLHVSLADRHLLDILRTTAHELAHCKQNDLAALPDDAGETGSEWENEAHAVAGILMRNFADAHPEYFNTSLEEGASGYIPTKRQARDPRFSTALTVDIKPGEVGRQANKMALKTDAQGKPALLMKTANLREDQSLEERLRNELTQFDENFADGKIKGKSRPGRVKKAGASCDGSVTSMRQKAKNTGGERAKMYHWCANMKSGKKK